jgi:hypothetical protein
MNTHPPSSFREALAAWLAERVLDQSLAEDPPPRVLRRAVHYDEKPVLPKPGEVYLLRPTHANWGPVYVLVLEPAPAGWRVVPFGRYATPAVPGEWATGLEAVPLRVLCGWNSRVVRPEVLLPGVVKRMAPKRLVDFISMYRHIMTRAPAPKKSSVSLGPPLIHPADPRYAYLDEERTRLDDHVPSIEGEGEEDNEEPAPWLLAAEGRPRYGADKE